MLSIDVLAAPDAASEAYPSPLSAASRSADPMLASDYAFFSFNSPAAGLLPRSAMLPSPGELHPVSPCTAAITHAAMAAMADPFQHVPASAMSLPDDFYLPNFHEYDQRQYALATNPEMRRQNRLNSLATSLSGFMPASSVEDMDDDGDVGRHFSNLPSSIPPALLATAANLDPVHQAELRRQIHIQSEQKRRAQIKDGFEELRRQLPNCHSKKLSKAVILARTTTYLGQVKAHAMQLQQEVEQLREENSRLRQQYGAANDGAAHSLFPMNL